MGTRMFSLVKDMLKSVYNLNELSLSDMLEAAFEMYPVRVVCADIIAPMMWEIGSMWERGEIMVVMEHFASNVIITKLKGLLHKQNTTVNSKGPVVIVGCAPEEFHEIGALIVSFFMSLNGWKVVYLGQNVPPSDIMNIVDTMEVHTIAMSASSERSLSSLKLIGSHIASRAKKKKVEFLVGGRLLNTPNVLESIASATTRSADDLYIYCPPSHATHSDTMVRGALDGSYSLIRESYRKMRLANERRKRTQYLLDQITDDGAGGADKTADIEEDMLEDSELSEVMEKMAELACDKAMLAAGSCSAGSARFGYSDDPRDRDGPTITELPDDYNTSGSNADSKGPLLIEGAKGANELKESRGIKETTESKESRESRKLKESKELNKSNGNVSKKSESEEDEPRDNKPKENERRESEPWENELRSHKPRRPYKLRENEPRKNHLRESSSRDNEPEETEPRDGKRGIGATEKENGSNKSPKVGPNENWRKESQELKQSKGETITSTQSPQTTPSSTSPIPSSTSPIPPHSSRTTLSASTPPSTKSTLSSSASTTPPPSTNTTLSSSNGTTPPPTSSMPSPTIPNLATDKAPERGNDIKDKIEKQRQQTVAMKEMLQKYKDGKKAAEQTIARSRAFLNENRLVGPKKKPSSPVVPPSRHSSTLPPALPYVPPEGGNRLIGQSKLPKPTTTNLVHMHDSTTGKHYFKKEDPYYPKYTNIPVAVGELRDTSSSSTSLSDGEGDEGGD